MFRRKASIPSTLKCPGCGAEHTRATLHERLYVCNQCERNLPMPSQVRIAKLADPGTFREFDRALTPIDPLKFVDSRSYRERLKEARRETGSREAITTGICRIGEHPVILMVFDVDFLGGTMGSVVGEKIAHAFEEASRRRLPVVSITATGGARVQEGMLSLMQMAKVAAAAARHDRDGLAFISILSDPTFGGVTASFASLGDVLLAESGAQIGFVGPRVIEQTTGVAPPKDSHLAETLLRAGLIDRVVPRAELRNVVAYLIDHLRKQPVQQGRVGHPASALKRQNNHAWETVGIARRCDRPTAEHYISRMCTRFLELHGDRWGGDDPAIIGGLAEINGQTVMVVAQERGSTTEKAAASHGGMAFPEGYRKALRLMRLAAKFGHPVVTLVDCPNAQASYESEQRGIAHALASNLAGMSCLPTPIISVIIGQGGSGGAVALAVADKVLMLEHAIYSVISPEGAASILYRDVARAESVAEGLKLTAHDLLSLGIIDVVVPEPEGGAHRAPDVAAATLKNYITAALDEVRAVPTPRLLDARYDKYRHIGRVGIRWSTLLGNAARGVAGLLARPWIKATRKAQQDAPARATSQEA